MALVSLSPRATLWKVLGLLTVLVLCGAADTPPSTDVGGTGHIEPRGGVVALSGAPGATIRAIKVKVGQTVKRGDLLMLLDDTQPQLDLKAAVAGLESAKRDAALALASEAVALRQAIEHYRQAKTLADGYRSLGPEATSLSQRLTYDTNAADARDALGIERRKEAQAHVSAAASVQTAQNHLITAQNALSHYQIAAPSDGVVLQITQHEGESSSGGPLVLIGDISQMYVTCQVFQGDLLKVHSGMRATITSNAMNKTLTGTVVQVSRLITPATQTGDVRIKLDDTDLASRLVGMEVEVKILL